jgi:hypothetical protein
MPLQLRDKSDFIPKLTINTRHPQAELAQHPFFSPPNSWSAHPDPNPSSSISQDSNLQMADQDQALMVNLIFSKCNQYYLLRISILSFHPLLFLIGPSYRNFDSCRRPSSIVFPRPRRSLLKSNFKGSPSRQHCRSLRSGRTVSRTGLCLQLQVGETGIREYLMTAPKQATGTLFASPTA